MDFPWLLILACAALLVRVGMAIYASGVSRSKNAAIEVVVVNSAAGVW